ncbi:hypothetical protein EPO05_02425 [Patescibacteria group bacterium]|nr:MAG: hypothetical protein EPO05_02425 [Patescibacteria group bacterium]
MKKLLAAFREKKKELGRRWHEWWWLNRGAALFFGIVFAFFALAMLAGLVKDSRDARTRASLVETKAKCRRMLSESHETLLTPRDFLRYSECMEDVRRMEAELRN